MHTYNFTYPRRTVIRKIIKGIGKIIFAIAFQIRI